MNARYAELFWYWIREREFIRIKKEDGEPPPWTKDPILQQYHFCNVHREDDRGTREIRRVVRDHLGCHNIDFWDLPWVYTAGRLFNRATSLSVVLNNPRTWPEKLKDMRANGAKVFHNAYTVATTGMKKDKVDYVAYVVSEVKARNISTGTLHQAHKDLCNVYGIGSFMGGQIVADLKNHLYLENAPDRLSWSCIGPGSAKGLGIIFECPVGEASYPYCMERLYETMPQDIRRMCIHAQDLQNCLCEFSKYIRLTENRKGRRRPYHARQDVQHIQH